MNTILKSTLQISLACFMLSLGTCGKLSGSFENAGAIEKTNRNVKEKEVDPSTLPPAIKDDIQARYPGAEMLEADEIKQRDGVITYDVEIRHNGGNTELMYDSSGKFLGIESDDDEDDDDEDDDDEDDD